MPAELISVKRFPCLFAGCKFSFKTQSDYFSHRNMEHEHCKKCNLDFEDWNAFVAHKAQSDRHLSCAICGADYKSEDGLKVHVQQMHRRDQKLVCHGCNGIFPRAGTFMAHVEQGKCKNAKDKTKEIKKSDLETHFHRKIILENYLNKPQPYTQTYGPSVAVSASYADKDEGGVDVLDHLDKIKENTLNRLPALQPSRPVAKLPISENNASVGENCDDSEVRSNEEQGVIPIDKLALDDDDDDNDAKRTPSSSVVRDDAWKVSTASNLFPNAKPVPMSQAFAEGLAARENEYGQQTNMFRTKFWDPSARGYNAESFFNQIIQRYECPWPGCDFNTNSPNTLTHHLRDQEIHAIRNHRCPACLRIFKTASALISHCESATERCNIKQSRDYGKAIDKLSGGFISVVREENNSMWGPKFETTKPVFGW